MTDTGLNLKKQRALIFVGAHPDDETFGIGGTLAKYASEGVRVYYVCGTRGEVGTDDPEEANSPAFGDLRWKELMCAAGLIGLTDVIYLGYRDSGMPGSEDNHHPNALAAAPLEQVTERIVKIIRELKPEVVVTFDPIGGYRHPDHIAIHNAAVAAFHAAGNPDRFPDTGTAYRPQKLYFSIFSRRLFKLAVKILPLFGQDPRHFGRNKDVDITSLVSVEFPVHASVTLAKQYVKIREEASACYVSQQTGGSPRRGVLGLAFRLFSLFGNRDLFMRSHPMPDENRETDLFQGVA